MSTIEKVQRLTALYNERHSIMLSFKYKAIVQGYFVTNKESVFEIDNTDENYISHTVVSDDLESLRKYCTKCNTSYQIYVEGKLEN